MRSKRDEGRCYKCHEYGHIARECNIDKSVKEKEVLKQKAQKWANQLNAELIENDSDQEEEENYSNRNIYETLSKGYEELESELNTVNQLNI